MQPKFDMMLGAQTTASSEPLCRASFLLMPGDAEYLFFFSFYVLTKSLPSWMNDGMPVITARNMHPGKETLVRMEV